MQLNLDESEKKLERIKSEVKGGELENIAEEAEIGKK